MNEKKATPNNEAAPKELHPKSKAGNDAAAQRLRAIELLRTGPKSTLQLRRDGDILSPAARILELKRRGFDILTNWVHEATDCGKLPSTPAAAGVVASGASLTQSLRTTARRTVEAQS